MAEPIRVLLADDHAVVREGLRTFLELQDGIEVVGEAADGERGRRGGRAPAPRRRPDGPRHAAARRRRRDARAARAVPARARDRAHELRRRRAAAARRSAPGAAGYLLKNVEPQELARAVRAAHAGEALLDPAVAARLVEAIARAEPATPRRRGAHPARARGARPDRRAASPTSASRASSASPRRRSRRTSGHVLAKLGVADRTQAARARGAPGLVRRVLGPIADGDRDPAAPTVGACPPPSSPERRAASASRWPARSPTAGWRLVVDARDGGARSSARPAAASTTSSPSPATSPTPGHRAARSSPRPGEQHRPAGQQRQRPRPEPAARARRLPARRARARLRASTSSRRSRSSRLALPRLAPGARDRQHHLRRGRRGLRGLGRLRLLQGGARAAHRRPRRRAPGAARLRRRPGRHAHADAPGGLPRRGHLRPPAARGQRAGPAGADRGRRCRAAATGAARRSPLEAPAVSAAARFELPPRWRRTSRPRRAASRATTCACWSRARGDGALVHARFRDLPDLLAPGDLLVVNTSATSPRPLDARRADGDAGRAALRHRRAGPADGALVGRRAARRADGARPSRGAARRRAPRRSPAAPRAELVAPYARRARGCGWRALDGRASRCTSYLAAPRPPDPLRLRARARGRSTPTRPSSRCEPGSAEMPSAGRPVHARARHARSSRGGVPSRRSLLHTGVSSPERDEPPYPERYRVPDAHRAAGQRRARLGRPRHRRRHHRRARARDRAADGRRVVRRRGLDRASSSRPSAACARSTACSPAGTSREASHLRAARGGRRRRAARARATPAALEHGYLWHEFGDIHLILP